MENKEKNEENEVITQMKDKHKILCLFDGRDVAHCLTVLNQVENALKLNAKVIVRKEWKNEKFVDELFSNSPNQYN